MKSKLKNTTFLLTSLVVLSLTACKKKQTLVCDEFSKTNITYKTVSGIDLTLDIYKPTLSIFETDPVLIFIHGGGWHKGSKDIINKDYRLAIKDELREAGYAIISIDYRLANGQTTIGDLLEDCKDAVRWIYKSGTTYGLDTSKIGLWGSSAGAHLALTIGYSNDNDFIGDANLEQYPSQVDYIIDNFGPTNLVELLGLTDAQTFENLKQTNPNDFSKAKEITQTIFGLNPVTDFNLSQQNAKLYSATNYVNQNSPPTLIMHGNNDNVVDIAQSILLKDTLVNHNIANEYYEYNNVEHGFDEANNGQLTDITNTIVTFVKKH